MSLAQEGHGAYSFVISTVGKLRSLSYLAGTMTGIVGEFDGFIIGLQVLNVTLGGTTMVPNVFFQGPFNADLITVGPGDDRKYAGYRDDETGETIVRGCNGLAPGVDGVEDWFPVQLDESFPKFANLRTANRGWWDARSDPAKGGRLFTSRADTLTKVPSSWNFFVVQDVPFSGYLFPFDEGEALLTPLFRRNTHNLRDLPDIPGFLGSGKELAAYFVEVLLPAAQRNPDNRLVTFARGRTTIEIFGIETELEVTVAAGARRSEFDLCSLVMKPCTF